MELVRARTRLSILWLIKVCHAILLFILSLLELGAIEELKSGKLIGKEITEGLKIYFVIVFLIFWIMAWACMTLKVSIIRWANTVLGVLGAISLIFGTINDFNKYSSAILISYIIGAVLFLIIAWYGWKLPKDEA